MHFEHDSPPSFVIIIIFLNNAHWFWGAGHLLKDFLPLFLGQRPVTRPPTSVLKFTTSLAWFVSFWHCWEKDKNVLLDNINIPNSVYFNIALRHNKVCFYFMSKTTYTRHSFMCLMWSLKNYSQITSIATEIIKQPFKCQLY